MHSNFEQDELQAPLSEINMTPLVDVMLVLFVIFLVSAPLLSSAIEMKLPQEQAADISDDKAFVISINQGGKYFIDDKIVSLSALKAELQNIAKTNPKRSIHLRADIDVAYGKVSHILALMQRLELSNIGFVTQPN